MAKIIAMVNQKGGVAKTTSASALAYGLAQNGKKVLLLDFDPQGNLTRGCGVYVDGELPPALKLLKVVPAAGEPEIAAVNGNLDLIGSSIGLETANIYLSGKPCREQYLKRALKKYDDKYDYIIVDSNPSLSVITLNVLSAADEIIVPFKPEFNSEQGVDMLIETIEEIKAINQKLSIRGFLVTMADCRRCSTQGGIAYIRNKAEQCGSKVYAAVIRSSVVAADAPKSGLSVYEYRPNCPLVRDYEQFVNEFLEEEKE